MKKVSVFLCAALIFALFSGCGTTPAPTPTTAPTPAGPGGEPVTTPETPATGGVVNFYNWGDYIDEDILAEFTAETGIKVNYMLYETNEQLYSILRQGGSTFDVIIPSDYMISRLIAEDMLETINLENVPNYALIADEYKGMDYDPTGEYAVPYMWGTVGIIYNTAMIEGEIDSWAALFDEEYAGQILMFDNARDAMGIALLYLGYSVNTTDADELKAAYDLLAEQKPLLQAYVMDQIFDKLEGGEAAIGPYYAGDYLMMSEANPDLAFVVPKEGTNIFVDCMCIPKGAENKENAEALINFLCRTDISLKNSEYIGYTSPNSEVKDLIDLDDEAIEIMFPSAEVLERCEFFLHLPQDILDLYNEYWIQLKA